MQKFIQEKILRPVKRRLSITPKVRLTVLLLLMVAISAGCRPTEPAAGGQPGTIEALAARVAGTATAEAGRGSESQEELATAQVKATEEGTSLVATQTQQASLDTEEKSATATAFAPFFGQLRLYGVDPEKGRPGWIHPPVTLELTEYRSYDYANDFMRVVAQDFVVSADITWNTQYGGAGCGFVLRSDGKEEAFNQYLVAMTRGASGHVLFGTMAEGELVNLRDLYAYGLDPEFDFHNDTTNNLTIVGRGQKFAIYTNQTLLGEIDPSEPPKQPLVPSPPRAPTGRGPAVQAAFEAAEDVHKRIVDEINERYTRRLRELQAADTLFERGFVAMVALSESGDTRCQFDNAWLWLIEE